MASSIRPAFATDAQAVASVLIQSRQRFLPFAPLRHADREVQVWIRDVLIPAGRVVVYERQCQVVGFLSTSETKACAWVDHLYVLPGFTGKEVGTQLLRHAHGLLPRPIRLYTFQQNTGARRFYGRHGYVEIAFTNGEDNEEACPDVLFELAALAPGTTCFGGPDGTEPMSGS